MNTSLMLVDLNALENEISNVINSVKKTDNNSKIIEIENTITIDHDHVENINTQEFKKLIAQKGTAR